MPEDSWYLKQLMQRPSLTNHNWKAKVDLNYNTSATPSTNGDNVTSLIARLVMEEVAKSTLSENSGFIGQALGNLFGSGQNDFKWQQLGENFVKDSASSLAGTAVGFGSNLIGRGITSLGGNTPISRGFGAGLASGLGGIGGTIASNLINHGNILGNASKLFGTGGSGWMRFSTDAVRTGTDPARLTVGAINPYALGMSVAGAGLQAAFGPSKEYEGRYGNITRSMDTAYDAISAGAAFVPGFGLAISGAMALNKGLSNLFGSTSGMTKADAILGSAFMPAPVKWLNAGFGSSTGSFDNQSFLNLELATNFMQDGFGNLGKRFDLARKEANKTYGFFFSQGAKRDALRNIDFANEAWEQVMDMAYQNRYQKIRSEDMASINNQRYAQMINGGWSPVARGKLGMKILNNATNHNIGMRLLSAAALIDNKQMILSALTGTKLEFKSELDWSPESWFSKRVKKPDGTLYNEQEAKILASHVPEYHNIEQTSKANGTWLKMPDGSIWEGDPRSWVMMLSEAFKKNYSEVPWYTGQAEWPTIFNYDNEEINTNKVTRAPYYNGLMWFSNSKSYGDVFAHAIDSEGSEQRYLNDKEKHIKGHNFLSAIPKKGNYRFLEAPPKGTYDHWYGLPYRKVLTNIERVKRNSEEFADRGDQNLYFPNAKEEDWENTYKTDDVANWSKELKDEGIFINKVYDGPNKVYKDSEGNYHMYGDPSLENSIDEFISQPGFTNKVKFIEGNTGDFDINNPYKYAYNKINKNKQMILSAKGGTKVKKSEKDSTYETAPMKEVVITARKKYIAGYDENGNPIYTEDPKESMGYNLTNPKADYDKGIQAIKDSEKPKYTDAFVKAAQLGIGAPLVVTTAPATIGTLFKASEPVMNILARPATTATRVASRLFPSLSRALPYTEMADRGLMGYLGARGMYDAGKSWYQGTMPWYQAVPQIGLSGLMMADAAPLVRDIPKVVKSTTTALQNNYPALFDSYTSWDATLGYHGDNIFSRVIGTVARNHGLTPKAEVPEFHRRLRVNEPETFRMTDDGKFIMSSGRTGDGHDNIVNFTTSEPARGHSSHRSLSGINDFIIPSEALKGVKFKSIQPSDTFFEVPKLTVNPKQVTIVSGDPETLNYARSLGMRTLSSPRLRQFNSLNLKGIRILGRVPKTKIGRFNTDKGAEYENAEEIGREIQRLTSMRGAPTMQDYALFESQTGLNSGVIPNTSYNLKNKISLIPRYSGNTRSTPIFNNVIYDPATNIEVIYRKAKIGERPWSDYYEALEKMPSARQQLGMSFTTPTITSENAASITPEQWTAAQDAAIARGDMAEAQRLRDLHASLTPTATPGKYYRGTNTKRNSYPDRHIDEEVGEMNGIYLTKKPKYAKTYGDVEDFYLRSNNPLYTEGNWTGVIDDATRAKIENAGYDAVVNDRFDTGFLNKLFKNSRDETITFNGRNIKSADAVTYDNSGVRIPLGLRDNFKLNDIRYGWVPWFLGGSTAATLHNKSK